MKRFSKGSALSSPITPFLQFGTSRFLQAHADLFISQCIQAGQNVGPITVVQTSGSSERSQRLAGLVAPGGFPVHIKGLHHGEVVDQIETVRSIVRTLSAQADWQALENVFVDEAAYVMTNTADAGYDISAESAELPSEIPISFPGKLTKLLHARFIQQGGGLSILPCELISGNGGVLRGLVNQLADAWYQDTGFLDWLEKEVLFLNTLVDRIVSEPIEPAGAVAEPYALWAIESKPGFVPFCQHPSIIVADDITSYEKLKLFILNLGHTVLADDWKREGRPDDLTVRVYLSYSEVKNRLLNIYEKEVIPGFSRQGMEVQAKNYVRSVLERFENPFLNHRLAEIFGNHHQKIERRIKGFIHWSGIDTCAELQKIIDRNQVQQP